MENYFSYKSYSKINLFLDITSKLKNGYHSINSLFCEVSLNDEIDVKINEIGILRYFDKKNILPENNLLKKAGELFCSQIKKIPFGIDFHIDKNIPMGGGLGGGSSNAAAVLKILNSLWNVKFSNKKLMKMSKFLGADVPFFINGGLQKLNGIGDKIKQIKIKDKGFKLNLLLVFPNSSVSTKDAYELIDRFKLYSKSEFYDEKYNNIIYGFKNSNYPMITENIYNVFEEVVLNQYPEIRKVYLALINTKADKVFMTGSGSTLVGIYSDKEKINNAMNILSKSGHKSKEVSLIFNNEY